MESETKKKFRDELFELRMQQLIYRAEHKEGSPMLDEQIKSLKKDYSKELTKERMGEMRK